jgi:hypothetical protein
MSEMKFNILATAHLTPVKMLLEMLKTVLEGVSGGGEHQTQQRAREVPDLLCSQVLPGEVFKLGEEGRHDVQQEEASKDYDTVIPYHKWY